MIWTSIAALTIASMAIEYFIMSKLPWLFNLTVRFPLFAMACSFFISWLLGDLFGGKGVIVLISGALSTIGSIVLNKIAGAYIGLKEGRRAKKAGVYAS